MEGERADRWRIELRSVGSGSWRVSRFRRSPGCSADTVKAALGPGVSTEESQSRSATAKSSSSPYEFDQGIASDGR